MRVAYGPPGHKGVTHLVAVGDTGDGQDPADQSAMLIAVGVVAVGFLVGSSTARNLGIGGVLTLLGASWWRSRRKVEITQPQ